MGTITSEVSGSKITEDLGPFLEAIIQDNPGFDPQRYLASGGKAYRTYAGDLTYGLFLAHIEPQDGRREFVIVGAKGVSPGYARIAQNAAILFAEKYECDSIRIHTTSRAVGRLMASLGWKESEIIYRRDLDYGKQKRKQEHVHHAER